MKILKKIVYALVVLVLLFIALGFIKSEVPYGHEITVTKSVEEAWAVSEDKSKFSQWLEGFVSETLVSGEEGQPGSTYKVVVKTSPKEEAFEMTETLVAVKENEFVEMEFQTEQMDFSQVMRFTPEGSGAKITTESVVKGKGMLMRSIFAAMELFGNSFQKQEEYNINNLKKVIEENTTDYFAEAAEEVVE